MSIEIYYFSGTGNSLYVARELQRRIPDSTLIPIVSLLNKDVIQTKGKSIGVIFPVHALMIPIAVKKFLRKADMKSAEYIFAVATRWGTVFRGFEAIDKLLKKKGKHLDAHFILNMYMNDPRDKKYKSPTEADILKLESVIQKRLDSIQGIIEDKKISREKDTEYLVGFQENSFLDHIIEKSAILGITVSEYIGGVNYFCSDSKCMGCGVCEKVCLSQKIKMVDKKPVWQKKVLCYMCYACVNYCPVQSVQVNDIPFVKSCTRENGRYTHPYASVKDICKQKKFSENQTENSSTS